MANICTTHVPYFGVQASPKWEVTREVTSVYILSVYIYIYNREITVSHKASLLSESLLPIQSDIS